MKALRMSCKLREAKPRNKILDRCKALATMLLICALYDKFADIVMPTYLLTYLFTYLLTYKLICASLPVRALAVEDGQRRTINT